MIDNGFVKGCSRLTHFDSSGLTALKTIGKGFLALYYLQTRFPRCVKPEGLQWKSE